MIAGKSMPTEGNAKSFAYVQTYDTKPKRRLFEVLKAQGMQPNQQVTFLTDGGADVRELPLYLNPQAEHLIDWFHITMRLTVMNLCPHAIGWKNGRLRVLSYQVAATTTTRPNPDEPTQRWRCMFLDEIEAPVITDGRWESASNYSPSSANGIDELLLAVDW